MSNINEANVTETELLDAGYRKYSGKEMDIYYNQHICEHAGKCVKGNPDVFEVGRRPWIITDNGDTNSNERVLNTCPTGALKYIKKEIA